MGLEGMEGRFAMCTFRVLRIGRVLALLAELTSLVQVPRVVCLPYVQQALKVFGCVQHRVPAEPVTGAVAIVQHAFLDDVPAGPVG